MAGRARWESVVWVVLCGGVVLACGTAEAPPPGAPAPSVVPTGTADPSATGRAGPPRPTTEPYRPGGNSTVRFELPTVGSDYAQKSQWVERLVNNCDEALKQRTQCLRLKFSFFSRDGGRRTPIGDPGSDYDSDRLGNCTVTKMAPEGSRNRYVEVNSTVSIEVVCTPPNEPEPDESQPDGDGDSSPPSN